MSGLVAVFPRAGVPDRASLLRRARPLGTRGPAGRAVHVDDHVGVVVAQATPHDGIAVVDGWVVGLVGDVDNARALATELRARGVDPEQGTAGLVARVFAEAGVERGLSRLDGAFAFVAYDARTGAAWCARDRTGLRPLHRVDTPTETVVATAVEGGADPDEADLDAFFSWGFLPPPRAWDGARALAAGVLVRMGPNPTEQVVHAVAANPPGSGGNRERWEASVVNAVRLAALRACDGDVVIADGGGIASSLLVRQVRAPTTLALDDLGWGPALVRDALAEPGLEAPPGDPLWPAWWALARAAADRGATALVTGHGLLEALGDRVRPGPAALVRERVADAAPFGADPAHPGATVPELEAVLAGCPAREPGPAAGWFARRVLLPERTLRAVDLACAAHGVVPRAPFAGALFLDVVAQVPFGLLRPRALGQPLVATLTGSTTPHRPLTWPVGAWLDAAGALAGLAERLDGWVAPEHVRWVLDRVRGGDVRHELRLWRLVSLATWRATRPTSGLPAA